MDSKDFIEACRKDGQKIERLIRAFYSALPGRDVLIDGGAHVGYHTGYARRFFNRVVSVEASPKTYIEHIRTQAALTATGPLCEVIPINAALGSRTVQGETIEFFFSEAHPGRSTVNTKMWDSWAKGSVVYDAPIKAAVLEVDDLKALFAHDRKIDFIKLDLEGNEVNALRGAAGVLKSDRPAVVMEFGLKPANEDIFGDTCAGFVAMMQAAGYALFAPWAEPAEQSVVRGYPFWYLFALPQGADLPAMTDLLRTCYKAALAEK